MAKEIVEEPSLRSSPSAREEDRRIRSLRPAIDRPSRVDRPLDVVHEDERTGSGLVRSATVFLLGAECPFTCVFCDLWRYTLERPTPNGALPAQLDDALRSIEPRTRQLKLYNASNFFEPRAVPDVDREALLERLTGFERIVVESHPRLVGERAAWWAERVGGRLEVALGLETVHPEAFRRLNKGAALEDHERAARRLAELGVGLRCFVLVGAPFVAVEDQVEWVDRTVRHAAELGARTVSLIPVRGGNGELERLSAAGSWRAPTLELFEECVDVAMESDRGASGGLVVQADPWDLRQLAECERCADRRVERLRRINVVGVTRPRVGCEVCGSGRGAPRDR